MNMKDKEDVVMDENVQNLENTGSSKDQKESSNDPWGCGTIVIMLVVGLCINMCSVLKEIRNDSHRYSSRYSSNWSDAYTNSTVNDSNIVDSVIPAYYKQEK